MDHPVLIFHQAATAEPKLGICRCWCLLNLENTAYLRQKQVFSPYASFTNMLNNWVGTLAPLTFHDFWSLFNLWCSNTLFWSADVLLGQSSAQKGTKRYTHEQTESRKRTSTKLTINFLVPSGGFFPIPIPSPYPWTWQSLQGLDMDASLRLRAASPTQVGLNNLGIRWREEKVKQRRLGS